MKKASIPFIIISAAFSVWGIADIYNYFTIGKEALLYYQGADVVSQLVHYNLTQGVVKIVLGLCVLLILLIKNRNHK